MTEQQAASLIGRLLPEAVFSVTEDRRRLMAAAMAATFSPDFDLEEKSRITRAIATLEPSDIVTLRAVHAASGAVRSRSAQGEGQATEPRHSADQVSLAALVATACVLETLQIGSYQYRASALGSALLRFLAEWEPSSAAAP